MKNISQLIETLITDYNLVELNANEDLTYLWNFLIDAKVRYGGDKELPDYLPVQKLITKYL